MSWIESYRGTVSRWEVDNVDHFTVAFYFARLEDATQALLHAAGLDPQVLAASGLACVTVDCRVRYRRELRVGDVLHFRSAITHVGEDVLRFVHEVVDSDDGTVCATIDQGIALVEAGPRARLAFSAAHRQAALALGLEAAPAAEGPPAGAPPTSDKGFVDAALDAIRQAEVDALGEAQLSAYIHRFTAANAQILAAFGMTSAYCRQERRGFSTFGFRLDFPGVLRTGDLVRVRSGLLHVGTSSVRIAHRMTNARTGELVSTLEQAGVNLDLEARRPSPWPMALRERAVGLLVSL
jgi:acyl-CoA thioesterase FadM